MSNVSIRKGDVVNVWCPAAYSTEAECNEARHKIDTHAELFAACESGLRELESFCHAYHVNAEKHPTIRILREAIARATRKDSLQVQTNHSERPNS